MDHRNNHPASEIARKPLVSIALCTYNGATYLHEQMESLLAQTYDHFELVVADDGSTDGTVAIVAAYARRDPRVRLSVNPDNLGFKRNFECTLASCRGEFVAPCDQDDIWMPEKLSRLLAAIGSADMVYCDSELIDSSGAPLDQRISDHRSMQNLQDAMPLAMTNCVSGHAMIFRRALLARAFPIPYEFFHDWWLAAVAAGAGGVVYVHEVLVQYRQHAGNVTDLLGVRKRVSARDRGYGLTALREIGRRIDALATLKGRQQPVLQEWNTLWNARETQWLSIALGLFMLRHRRRIYALKRYSELEMLGRTARFFYGLKSKQLVRPYKYRMDASLDTP